MSLKFKVDSLDEVPEEHRGHYRQSGNLWLLDVVGDPSGDDVVGHLTQMYELLREKREAKARPRPEPVAPQDPPTFDEKTPRGRFMKLAYKRLNEVNSEGRAAELAKLAEEMDVYVEEEVAPLRTGLQQQHESLRAEVRRIFRETEARKLAAKLAVQGSSEVLFPHILARLSAEIPEKGGVEAARLQVLRDGKPTDMSIEQLCDEIRATPGFAPLLNSTISPAQQAAQKRLIDQALGRVGPASSIARADFELLPAQQRTERLAQGITIQDS